MREVVEGENMGSEYCLGRIVMLKSAGSREDMTFVYLL